MKTVKQQAEVSFKLLDFADKVVMLPLMNMFAAAIRANMKVDVIITENMSNEYIIPEQTKKIFKLLSDLGCRTSLGESYEDIVKSDDSQRKTILFLESPIPIEIRLQIVKIIKEQLNIGLKEAKDLIDACPTKIDLDNYSIPTAGYKYLLNELSMHGVMAKLITKE